MSQAARAAYEPAAVGRADSWRDFDGRRWFWRAVLRHVETGPRFRRDDGHRLTARDSRDLPAWCRHWRWSARSDQPTPKPGWGEVHIGYWLMRSIDALAARPKTIAMATAAIAALWLRSASCAWISKRTSHAISAAAAASCEAYEFVETHLGGAGVWDVVVPAPAVLDGEYLSKVRRARGPPASDRSVLASRLGQVSPR